MAGVAIAEARRKTLESTPEGRIKAHLAPTWRDALSSEQSIIAARPPVQVLDAFAAGYPDLKGLTDTIKSDEGLMTAFHKALSNDETMLPGLKRMASDPVGGQFLKDTEKMLQNPDHRKHLTTALNNLADKKDVKFDHLEELVNSVRQYDEKDTTKSDARLQTAFMGVGLSENQSTQILIHEKTKAMVDGVKDFFKNPEQGLGKIGGGLENILEKFGMDKSTVSGLAGMLVGLLQGLVKFMGNIPGMLNGMWQGSQGQAFKEYYIDPALDRVKDSGQRSIEAARGSSTLDQDAVKSGEKGALKKASEGPINGTDLSGDKTRDADTPSGFVPPRPATSPPALGLQ